MRGNRDVREIPSKTRGAATTWLQQESVGETT
jgi:hypothetical protein